MTAFTDYLSNPVHVGDIITYPRSQGSSSAHLSLARVIEVDPLVPSTTENGRKCWQFASNLRKPKSKQPWSGETYPFVFGRDYNDRIPDDSKAYRLIVKRIREGTKSLQRDGKGYDDPDKPVYIKNVDRVVVVTGIVNFRPEDVTEDAV